MRLVVVCTSHTALIRATLRMLHLFSSRLCARDPRRIQPSLVKRNVFTSSSSSSAVGITDTAGWLLRKIFSQIRSQFSLALNRRQLLSLLSKVRMVNKLIQQKEIPGVNFTKWTWRIRRKQARKWLVQNYSRTPVFQKRIIHLYVIRGSDTMILRFN